MNKRRVSEERIVGVLKEAEAGMPMEELCRRIGTSGATCHCGKAKDWGLGLNEARRLRQQFFSDGQPN